MSSNSTSTDTSVPTSSTKASSTPTSSSIPTTSSSIANPSTSSPVSGSTSTNTSPTSLSTSDTSTSTTPTSTATTATTATTAPTSTTSPTSTQETTSATVITSPSSSTITSTLPNGSTTTLVQTSTAFITQGSTGTTGTASSSTSAATAGLQTGVKSSSSGLGTGGTIAVAVVVPIVAVALLVLGGLFLWRKRKARKDAEELRRKEVEEYGYNPNNDPTLPAVGSAGNDGPFEMREDGSAGYRGWGTTAVASSGRKASTTISGGQSAGGIGMAYSGETSPTHGPVSDTPSDKPLVDGRPLTGGEGEALGAMGPAASGNRNGDINRGPSNASSSYSGGARSDGSGEGAGGYNNQYYNQYETGSPYAGDSQFGSPPGRSEMPAQPVIRDVQARRNTRIENPSHFPQQSAGISQNF